MKSTAYIEYAGCTLHQIAPYIGKTKPLIARELIRSFSEKGDWIWDPFCGSGTIALEAKLQSRNVLAGDVNPYACCLTRSKLHAPENMKTPLKQIERASLKLHAVRTNPHDAAPQWVRKFFHSKTLKEARFLAREFIESKNYFLVGCLLGILHHQRPGFLSFPASHLIPYLRTKLFPMEMFPEYYQYRDPIPRMIAKVQRVLKNPVENTASRFRVFEKSIFGKYVPDDSIDVVLTSPPYMNNLDYGRDNRLRLWFLGIKDYKSITREEIRGVNSFEKDMFATLTASSLSLRRNGKCILIIGDVRKNGMIFDLPHLVKRIVKRSVAALEYGESWTEKIPDEHRSLGNRRGTIEETIMVFRKKR